jgi:hypothetical protein
VSKEPKTVPDDFDKLALEIFMAGGFHGPFKAEDQPIDGEREIYPHARVKFTARKIREFVKARLD